MLNSLRLLTQSSAICAHWLVRTSRWMGLGLILLSGPRIIARAGDLEDETVRLLGELPNASQEDTERILRRFQEIGPEARAAQDAVFEFVEDQQLKYVASEALAAMGMECLPLIRNVLKHKNPAVRSLVAESLTSLGPFAEPLVPTLLRLVYDDTEYPVSAGDDNTVMFKVSQRSAMALSRLRLRPQEVVHALVIRLMSVSDEHEAAAYADSLWELGIVARSAVPDLAVIALTHPKPYVRVRTLGALFATDETGRTTLKVLSQAIQDRDVYGMMWGSTVQREVVEDLCRFGPRAAVAAPALLRLLRQKSKAEDVDYCDICMIVADAGLRDTIPVLRRDLDRPPFETDSSRYVLFDKSKIPTFYEYTKDRAGGLAALAQLEGDNEAFVEELSRILQDQQWSITEEVGGLGARLRDPRAIAARGLGRLGQKARRTLAALRSAMKHDPDQVSELAFAAAWAVARIDPEDRDCLSILQHAVFHVRYWDSPYYGESPETVLAVLGPRIDELLPHIVRSGVKDTRFFGDSHFLMDLLMQIGPKALRMYVEQKFERLNEQTYFSELFPTLRELDDLGPRGAPAIAVLTNMLASKKHQIRAAAAYHLGSIGPAAAVSAPQLRTALADDRVIVRCCAARSLGRIGSAAEVVQDNLERLAKDDPYESVRTEAADALAKIKKRQ